MWKEVSGFQEYEVHPKHGVRRKGKDKTLKPRTWLGYPKVTLMRDGRKHEVRVHRLIAEHFIENPNNLPIVNHKDSNRSNYNVDNLEWVDNSGNQLHRWHTKKQGLKKIKYRPEYGLAKVAYRAQDAGYGPNKESEKKCKGLSRVEKIGLGAAIGGGLSYLASKKFKLVSSPMEHVAAGGIGALLGAQA
jgi:hypothetical protein